MDTLASFFGDQIKRALSHSKVPAIINEHNVYQESDANILPILDEMVECLLLPGSGIDGLENLEELLAKAESGKSCLILPEHYSNFDLSIISLLTRQGGGRGNDIANALIAISGSKLNEDNPAVAAFAGAYTRIVIYPSRYLLDLHAEKNRAEFMRAKVINRAALKVLNEKKVSGKMILVFPAGTRFRPWDPESKKGVREIDSYIRSFDYLCFIAINGEILHVQKTDMMNDALSKDVIRITAGPVIPCAEFHERARLTAGENDDKKQAVADAIMAELDKMHVVAEEKRQKLLPSR